MVLVPRASGLRPQSAEKADFLQALLERMTLEEKAGQLGVFSNVDQVGQEIREGKLGAIFNSRGAATNRELQRIAVEESRLGIPLIFGADVWHGMQTIFPIPLAEAASFEPELAMRTSRVAAMEATSFGIMWTFAPMVDVSRDARWGRVAEGSGEDVLLNMRFAEARVRGFQGDTLTAEDSLAACLKHFAGYGAAEAGLDYSATDMSEGTFRDVYLPPFVAGIAAGAFSVMPNFEALMGVPATGNRWLLTDVLRAELKFPGLVVSDYEADLELVQHGFAQDAAEAAKLALGAGVDMSMQSGIFRKYLPQLVRNGTISEQALNDAVMRVLKAKQALGLFKNPYRSLDPVREKHQSELAHASDELAREAGRKSIVLLKNDNDVLPLRAMQRIAVIGWWADDTSDEYGVGHMWGNSSDCISLFRGLAEVVDLSLLRVEPGVAVTAHVPGGLDRARNLARWADVVLLAVGESSAMAGESRSRTDVSIPQPQQELAEAVATSGKPMVVLLKTQRASELKGAIRDATAIMVTWQLGKMTGKSLADVLLGDFSPSGRLPVSFPFKSGQEPFYYSHMSSGRPCVPSTPWTNCWLDTPNAALYAFGHGLTYSKVQYGVPLLQPRDLAWSGSILATCNITNVGQRAISEVVQLYVHDVVASKVRPVRELKDFTKVILQPGETTAVSFRLTRQQLLFAPAHVRSPSEIATVEPGLFNLWLSPSSAEGQPTQFRLLGPEAA